MTQDEIIALAREAGVDEWEIGNLINRSESQSRHLAKYERFAALVAASRDAWWIEHMQGEEDRVRADEREACEMACEEFYTIEGIAQKCAAAIRARGNNELPK